MEDEKKIQCKKLGSPQKTARIIPTPAKIGPHFTHVFKKLKSPHFTHPQRAARNPHFTHTQ